jgi:hypothetical protein
MDGRTSVKVERQRAQSGVGGIAVGHSAGALHGETHGIDDRPQQILVGEGAATFHQAREEIRGNASFCIRFPR